MRGGVSRSFAMLSRLSAACAALAGLGFAAPSGPQMLAQRGAPAPIPVDVEVVLAVDVSYSMDPEEQALQREGYMAAHHLARIPAGVEAGHARPASRMTYFEWAGMHHQQIIVPWRLIDGPESADGFAADIGRARYTRASRTSISGALLFGAPLFEGSGYRGIRRVIDVSGDGVNNNGPLVTVDARRGAGQGHHHQRPADHAEAAESRARMDIDQLDIYYEDCVIGGPGAFVIPIRERDQFKEAIRTKLVLEIAGRTPERRVVPVAAASPRVSCTIGERLWQERWGN